MPIFCTAFNQANKQGHSLQKHIAMHSHAARKPPTPRSRRQRALDNIMAAITSLKWSRFPSSVPFTSFHGTILLCVLVSIHVWQHNLICSSIYLDVLFIGCHLHSFIILFVSSFYAKHLCIHTNLHSSHLKNWIHKNPMSDVLSFGEIQCWNSRVM